MAHAPVAKLGIAAVSVVHPEWRLGNDWFGDAMPRKFSTHTGIDSRAVSTVDEVSMAVEAVRRIERQAALHLADCRGLLFVSPSLLPPTVARRHLDADAVERERPRRVARAVAQALGLSRCRTAGLNWFCCGYSRALDVLTRRWGPRLALRDGEFVLLVVATRISRITDYSCRQTSGLFGDMATATVVAPLESRRHRVHFEILHADATRQPVERSAFDFHLRHGLPVPSPDGGSDRADERIVYSLDGMAIADLAPRAMAAAVSDTLDASGLSAADVDRVVPHQAGSGIVRFTAMQLESLGVRCDVVNGLTRHTGNTSACSIPHALHETWHSLHGLIACPTAAVGSPGRAEILRGCVLLRSTPFHDRQAAAAA